MYYASYNREIMAKGGDKFEAARSVAETIKDFDPADQEMIFRWAAESLGLPAPFRASLPFKPVHHHTAEPVAAADATEIPSYAVSPATSQSSQDIKSFVAAKMPRSDVQFVATVAYYYQFVAPPSEKKAALTKDHLLEAFRKVGGRKIPPHPEMTLNNAYTSGLLDRPEKGVYTINSVGENLVTMTLPGDGSTTNKKLRHVKKRSTASKKGSKKVSRKAKS